MAIVYLGIGSNLGDRQANIQKALGLIKENQDIQVLSVSAMIETEPEGACLPPACRQAGTSQGPEQGKFLNGALKIKTDLLPLDLLSQLKMVERRLGRVKGQVNGPRTMDLDILFYDDVVIVEGKNLNIPHPRLAQRAFVLKPLLEIAPDLMHPRLGRSVKELYEEIAHEGTQAV